MSGLFEGIAFKERTAQRRKSAEEEKKAAVIRKVAAEYKDLFYGVNKNEFRILFSSVSQDIKCALSRGGVKDAKSNAVVKTLLERYAQETIPTTEPDGNVQPSATDEVPAKTAQSETFEKKEEEPVAIEEEKPEAGQPEVGSEIQIADETGNADNPITVTVVEVLAEGIKVRLDEATENSQPGEYMVHEDAVISGGSVQDEEEPDDDESEENPLEEKTARDWIYSIPLNSTIQAWHDKHLDGTVTEHEMVVGMLTDVVPLLEKHIDALRLRSDDRIDEQMVRGLEDAHGQFFYLLEDMRSGSVEGAKALEEFEAIQDELYDWGDYNSVSLMG